MKGTQLMEIDVVLVDDHEDNLRHMAEYLKKTKPVRFLAMTLFHSHFTRSYLTSLTLAVSI